MADELAMILDGVTPEQLRARIAKVVWTRCYGETEGEWSSRAPWLDDEATVCAALEIYTIVGRALAPAGRRE